MKKSFALMPLLALCACGGLRIAEPPQRQVALRLQAAPGLNFGPQDQPLALVTRIYKLRQLAAFQRASFDSLLNGSDLGPDLIEMREVTLVPGQHYDALEKLDRDAAYIGVVGLFNAPCPQQWRLAFPAREAERSGISVGLNSCAISAGAGASPVR
ncbi:type VI secretion system lipoprotein TssJ [Pseudoduganella sp. RAF53_2]|uniref:type VI secretion system lipoprotein TssJ n=1 Tax=unclassified Pseudoduganella TaxID=2637179 RepID=UPI003F994635